MLYVPPISDYKPFYIQFATGAAKNILNDYKVIIKAHDYPSTFKVKEPYKNQWKDEHGDDEYIGGSGLYIEAFTFKMKCVMFSKSASNDSAIAELRTGMTNFMNALRQGFFKTYDSWTGYGFQNVRLQEFQMPGDGDYSVWDDVSNFTQQMREYKTRLIFTVVLKVNDPVTHLSLSGPDNNNQYHIV